MMISAKVIGIEITGIEDAQSRPGRLYSGAVKIEVPSPVSGQTAFTYRFPFQNHSTVDGALMFSLQSLKEYAEQIARSADKEIARLKR